MHFATRSDSTIDVHGLDSPQVWSTEGAYRHLSELGHIESKRTAERRLHEWHILPDELTPDTLRDELGQPPTKLVLDWEIREARAQRRVVLFAQLTSLPTGRPCLQFNDARGSRYWVPFEDNIVNGGEIQKALDKLSIHLAKPITLFPHGQLIAYVRGLDSPFNISIATLSYLPPLQLSPGQQQPRITPSAQICAMTHLDRLEAESIFMLREAVAEAANPAMLYSIGKDSSVMLHLACKAFYPAPPPFPLLHVDTRWKFREMYLFRDRIAQESGMDLLVHINPEAIERNINPFDHGSALHTDITKTEGLKQALDKYGFDVVFGGARRDEEKSRAKERIFSFRTKTHHWDPKNQRPELWNLYNAKKQPGESIRVFPLSNWTEIDIWQYIHRENIPIVPLYFAKERPVVVRDGLILMVDDDRMRLLPDEQILRKKVRFRTLGCYPLSGAIPSNADTLPAIILELLNSRTTERQGRAIDSDSSASMERKKQEGYF